MSKEKYPRVSIIIINWNGGEDTIECLESLYQINFPNFDVIVVDNNSQDESLEKIINYAHGEIIVDSNFLEYNPLNKPLKIMEYTKTESESTDVRKRIFDSTSKKLILIKNNKNYGFAEGNNIGIRFAIKKLTPKYVLLLNNDTVVDKYFLEEMVEIGENSSDIGILGPKIYFYDKPNIIWSAGCKISWKLARGIQIGSNEIDHGQYDLKSEVEYVSGSAFLIKTELIDKIGLMDEKYFLYFEETDLTLKASQVGYKSFYVPNARVWHKVSRSGGGITNPIGLYYITRNRWIFMKRWAVKSDYVVFIIYQIIGATIIPLLLSIYYRNSNLLKAYYKGLIKGLQW